MSVPIKNSSKDSFVDLFSGFPQRSLPQFLSGLPLNFFSGILPGIILDFSVIVQQFIQIFYLGFLKKFLSRFTSRIWPRITPGTTSGYFFSEIATMIHPMTNPRVLQEFLLEFSQRLPRIFSGFKTTTEISPDSFRNFFWSSIFFVSFMIFSRDSSRKLPPEFVRISPRISREQDRDTRAKRVEKYKIN